MLVNDIEEILEESGFRYCEYSGCFDIAARKSSMLLLKVLGNVDSFQEEQANNLKVISNTLDAKSFLVGLHTRREKLSDNIVYERFDVPTVNPTTLENILHGNIPSVYRFRGGLFVEVDPVKLKQAREESGLSQSQLAEKVGITKKSVYEHESRKMGIVMENAVRIEKILETKVTLPVSTSEYKTEEQKPRSTFEASVSRNFRRMGFETGSVYQSPFNMIAAGEMMLLSDVEENQKKARKNIDHIEKFSKLSRKSAIIVTKEEANFNIPTVREGDLARMKSKDLVKLVKTW